MIILEFMGGGDLVSYLRSHREDLQESVSTLHNVVLQVADAMSLLERFRVVHRDLAARNVLVSDKGLDCVKLSDVGLSRTLAASPYYKKKSRDKVPARWLAPESITRGVYDSSSDVWSFAVLCWEVFTLGAEPYGDMEINTCVRAVCRGYRMPRPALCPTAVYATMAYLRTFLRFLRSATFSSCVQI
eukprot:m.758146 g.758146  ORF g.758146 m.758146 type:complete len:187 (+) comp59033_c0_seq3:4323-4883(+)